VNFDYKSLWHKYDVRGKLFLIFYVATLYSGYQFFQYQNSAKLQYDIQKTAVTCPTLLSIARTSRDTLLVLRSEDLCVKYVMETLR